MCLGVTPFPVGFRIIPNMAKSWQAGNPAQSNPIAYLVHPQPAHPLPGFHLVAWFLLKAFYISHS